MTKQTETIQPVETLINASHAEAMNASRILYKEIQELKEMIAALMQQPASQPAPIVAGELSFKAETMTATVDSGKVYWKVKGGSFQKHGVTIWPEVLEEAGIKPDDLNPLKPVDLSRFVAVCSAKENGQPKKVIRLEQI